MHPMQLCDPITKTKSMAGISNRADWDIIMGESRRLGNTAIEMIAEIREIPTTRGTRTIPRINARWVETHIKLSKRNTRIICHNTPTSPNIPNHRINTGLSHHKIDMEAQAIRGTKAKPQATTQQPQTPLMVMPKQTSAATMLHETHTIAKLWMRTFTVQGQVW